MPAVYSLQLIRRVDMFKNWFGWSAGSTESTAGGRSLLQRDETEGASRVESVTGFLLRQPVIDASNRVIGHELGYRDASVSHGTDAVVRVLDDETLASFAALDLSQLRNDILLFVRIGPRLLESERLASLPKDRVVLAIDVSFPGVIEQARAGVQARASEGWRIAFDNLPDGPADGSLLSSLAFLRFDLRSYNAVELDRQIKSLRERGKLMLVARQVETEDDFEACQVMTFDAFQGYYFARMRPQMARRVDHDRIRVMRLLNLVAQRAEISELDSVLRRDAMLAYKLLVYINSPLSGLDHQLESIAQALMFLGYDPLYRWLTVLLFTCGTRHPRDRLLLQQALLRGRLLEQIGLVHLPRKDAEALFLLGMFSLLDVLLNTPMEEAIEPLNLTGAIREALLSGEGPYTPYLKLGIALEGGQWYDADALARSLGLNADRVNPLLVEAMTWAATLDNLPQD